MILIRSFGQNLNLVISLAKILLIEFYANYYFLFEKHEILKMFHRNFQSF